MKHWRSPLIALTLVLISALLIVILPLSSLAAPQGVSGTQVYLPVALNNFPLSPTATATATATATSTPTLTPTATVTPTPTSTPITPTIPITVGPVVAGNEMFVFSPVSVTIHVGDTIHWVWGSTGHTVTSGANLTVDDKFCSPNDTNCSGSGTSSVGATYDHQFLLAGNYEYFCKIHGPMFGMTGTVVVLP